jgi:putative ABC transport system permease protein
VKTLARWRSMATVALSMMLDDKLKMLATLLGVVFAVLLSNQQTGIFLGLINKNLMMIDHAGADVWVAPRGTQAMQAGKSISMAALMEARGSDGVAWAEPLLVGGATVSLPAGGSEAVQLIGTGYPTLRGGPWNLVVGDAGALGEPDTMIFEDSEREKLGGLNVGSVREVNGHDVRVGGFTWGLVPFGPSFAFADYDLARELLHTPVDQTSYVLVAVRPGVDPAAVAADLQQRLPDALVLTRAQFRASTVRYVLAQSAIGMTLGSGVVVSLIVGFVIVSLTMFSSIVDNLREFGTLKAIGTTNGDLAKLLVVQSVVYALGGSLIGLALVTQLAGAIRSAKLAIVLPPSLIGATVVAMVCMCLVASSLALLRLRKVEPAMVFR